MTLLMWILGALLSFCGLAVYLDLGTAIPRGGGERVYLERIFRRPHMLATCMFMAYVVLLGFSAPSCIVLGEYALYALDVEPNRWNARSIAVAVITLLCIIHSRYPRTGLNIISVLGIGKLLILAIVILSGFAGMAMGVGSQSSSIPTDTVVVSSTAHRNVSNLFANSSTQPYDYATALLKVLYCFRGYSTALHQKAHPDLEDRRARRTLPRLSPLRPLRNLTLSRGRTSGLQVNGHHHHGPLFPQRLWRGAGRAHPTLSHHRFCFRKHRSDELRPG